MDDPNITMEEYIRLEEEKARKPIAFNDEVSSEKTLSCEPTVSSLNDEIDFRIFFDDFDDEDYTVIFDKNSFSYKIISTNDLNTDSENDNEKVNLPSLPSPKPTVSCFVDLDFFNDFENEFPAIVYNYSQMSKSDLLTESVLSPHHIYAFDLYDETSLSEYNEEEQNVLYFNDLFPFNFIHPDDLKSKKDNDDNEIDIIQSSGDRNPNSVKEENYSDDFNGWFVKINVASDWECYLLTKIIRCSIRTSSISLYLSGKKVNDGGNVIQSSQTKGKREHEEISGINYEVLTNDQPMKTSEPVAQPSNKIQTPLIPFPPKIEEGKRRSSPKEVLRKPEAAPHKSAFHRGPSSNAKIVKLLESGIIYLISDSTWVSPIHVVPKKGGMTVVLNDNNELIPSRTVTGWRSPVALDLGSTRAIRRMALPPHDQRVQVFDFRGLPDLMADGLSARMLMEHKDAQGVREEMESLGFARYWAESARQIPDKGDLRDYWIGISSAGDIAGRSQAPEKMTVTDLFYLRGMDVGSVNVPYLLARYLRLFAIRRKSRALISGGQFVARLAEHFGLLTKERLQGLTIIAPELPIIDMAELVRLHICMDIDDTWAWVAMGPERQPDAAAGAHEAVEDALAVDEDMPQVVPSPPRTQGKRIARLEEEVHGMRELIQGQSEVLDLNARDFSRFAMWTVTSLARMMDRTGVTYTSYSETPREYQRRTRWRTGEASTSTAQQDQQQPDP
ncbi:hypothetical protein Tco_1483950 [Tanacetum coccineum]